MNAYIESGAVGPLGWVCLMCWEATVVERSCRGKVKLADGSGVPCLAQGASWNPCTMWYCGEARTRVCVPASHLDPPHPTMNAGLENESKEMGCLLLTPVVAGLRHPLYTSFNPLSPSPIVLPQPPPPHGEGPSSSSPWTHHCCGSRLLTPGWGFLPEIRAALPKKWPEIDLRGGRC